jgi:hypothetical protein
VCAHLRLLGAERKRMGSFILNHTTTAITHAPVYSFILHTHHTYIHTQTDLCLPALRHCTHHLTVWQRRRRLWL